MLGRQGRGRASGQSRPKPGPETPRSPHHESSRPNPPCQDLEKQRQQRLRRTKRSNVAGAKSKILAFLRTYHTSNQLGSPRRSPHPKTLSSKAQRKHGFKHSEENLNLNLPKRSAFGLCWTYPLHEAAKERDWQMVGFLLDFGADPARKDHRRCDLASYLDQMRAPDCVWQFLRSDT